MERKQFTRRRFLISLGATTLVLQGCGGWGGGSGSGGSTGGTLTSREYTGTVSLPSGLSSNGLRVVGAVSSSEVTGGQFTAKGFSEFATLVTLYEPSSEKAILIGMLDPDSSTQVIDATNCAATLIFIALGGSQLTGDDRQNFWTATKSSSVVAPLAQVIETRLQADMYALENEDGEILDALALAVTGPSGASMVYSSTSKGLSAKSRAESGAKISLQKPRIGEELNGLTWVNNNHQSITIHNQRLREGSLRPYLVRKTDSENVPSFVQPEKLVGQRIHLQAKKSSPDIPMALDNPTDRNNELRVIYLTPVFDSVEGEPFTASGFESHKAEWRTDLGYMYQRAETSLYGKVALEALGISGITFPDSRVNETLENLVALGGTTGMTITDAQQGRGLASAISTLAAETRDTSQSAYEHLAAIAPLLQEAHPVLSRDLAKGNLKSDEIQPFRAALRLISLSGALAFALDKGPEYRDLTEGEQGIVLELSLNVSSFSLNPSGGDYKPGQDKTISMTVSGQSGALTYKWSLRGVSNSTLDDQAGKTGADIETDQNVVLFKPGANAMGTAIIECVVYEGVGSERQEVGSDVVEFTRVDAFFLSSYSFEEPTRTWHYGMGIVEKRRNTGASNSYFGGTLYVNSRYVDPALSINDSANYVFNIEAYTGLPKSDSIAPDLVGTRVMPSSGGGGANWAGVNVYDLGDRLAIVKIRSEWYSTSTPEEIQFVRAHVLAHIGRTTITALLS